MTQGLETSDLLSYPFDQYQRYRDVREVIDELQSGLDKTDRIRILDVGGTLTTQAFLSGYELTIINLQVTEANTLLGDGSRLPFVDDAFEIVITVDTLEHLPINKRQVFVKELLRVSAAYTIITCPFANSYNEFSERILNDFIEQVLVGLHNRFLQEHLQNGLPDVDECLSWITQSPIDSAIAIPSGYIHHWLPLMLMKHMVMGRVNYRDMTQDLEIIYNTLNYWSDHRAPSYRQIIVAAKNKYQASLVRVEQKFKQQMDDHPPVPDLNGVVSLWNALSYQKKLKARDDEIVQLRNLIKGYESGRFIRAMSWLRRKFGL